MALEYMGDFFNARVDGYEEHMLKNIAFAEEFYSLTARALPTKSGARLLDLGCGTGLELDEYFKIAPDARVTCVDVAEKPLEVLKNKFADKAIEIINRSYFDVEFEKDAYDACVSVESLHHFTFSEKLELYKKILSALKDGGTFVETDYIAPNAEEEARMFSECARLRADERVPEGEMVHFDTPHTLENMLSLRRLAGFAASETAWRGGDTVMIISRKARAFDVREAAEGDFETLVSIYSQARKRIAALGIDQWQARGGYPSRESVLSDMSRRQLYVSELGGRVTAAAALCVGTEQAYNNIDGEWLQTGEYVTVHRLAAADDALGTGAAAALIARAVEMAKSRGCASVRADTHRGNVVMLRFLEKNGFVKRGTVKYDAIKIGDNVRVAYEKPV